MHLLNLRPIPVNLQTVLVGDIWFDLEISESGADAPPGFLFVCATEDFQIGPNSIRPPDCPAYWSLDPLGDRRLSADEAIALGFPTFKLTTNFSGWRWENSIYDRLRQFHQATLHPGSRARSGLPTF
jgi:hypothetical protein